MSALEDSLHYARSNFSPSLLTLHSPSRTPAGMTWQCVCESLAPEQLCDSYYEAFTTSLGRLQSLLGLLTSLLCRLRFFKEMCFICLVRWFAWLHYFLSFLIGNHKFTLLWDSSTQLFVVIWNIKGLFLKFLLLEPQTNPISFWVRKKKYTYCHIAVHLPYIFSCHFFEIREVVQLIGHFFLREFALV